MSIDGTMLEANRSALAFTGIKESEVIGKPFWETPWWTHSKEMQERLRAGIKKAAQGEFIRFEATHPAVDGSIHYVDFSLKPVTDEDGKVVLIIPEGRDITDRKQAEEEIKRYSTNLEVMVKDRTLELENALSNLQDTQQKLLQSEKMASIGQLAAGVAHEINNPMGFISSNLGSLRKYIDKFSDFIEVQSDVLHKNCTQKQLEALEKKKNTFKIDFITKDVTNLINESLEGANRVKKIVQDLKSFSHVDEMKYEYADINECIESTINIIWSELKYKATVKKDYGSLPRTKCYAGQLSQVFMNILVNAVN
jgi:PAS domain S-box-containing protein